MKNILVINGHQQYPSSEGRLNQLLFDNIVEFLAVKYDIETTVLSKGYIPEEEQDKYKWADAVILQTPVFWYSVPGLFKTYIDRVYSAGVFFDLETSGSGNCGLFKGKKYMLSLTMGSTEDVFGNPHSFLEGKTLDEIFIHLHKTHQFCGMDNLETFAVYDVMQNPNILEYIDQLHAHLKKVFYL